MWQGGGRRSGRTYRITREVKVDVRCDGKRPKGRKRKRVMDVARGETHGQMNSDVLKLNFRNYPAIHTNYMTPQSTTL